MANPARNIWVTSTALTTALNTAYFAESVATFVMAIGFALLLVGIGFLVLTLVALRRLVPALPTVPDVIPCRDGRARKAPRLSRAPADPSPCLDPHRGRGSRRSGRGRSTSFQGPAATLHAPRT